MSFLLGPLDGQSHEIYVWYMCICIHTYTHPYMHAHLYLIIAIYLYHKSWVHTNTLNSNPWETVVPLFPIYLLYFISPRLSREWFQNCEFILLRRTNVLTRFQYLHTAIFVLSLRDIIWIVCLSDLGSFFILL